MAFEWFERDDYPSILDVMEDKHRLPPTFDEWEKNAEAGVQALEAAGYVVVPILIKPDTFIQWCEAIGSRPDARGRLKFCNMRHRQSSQSPGAGHDPASRVPSSPDVIDFAALSRGHGAEHAESMSPSQDAAALAKSKPEPELRAPGGLAGFLQSIGLVQSTLKRLFSSRRH